MDGRRKGIGERRGGKKKKRVEVAEEEEEVEEGEKHQPLTVKLIKILIFIWL